MPHAASFPASSDTPNLQYSLSFTHFGQHLIDVEISLISRVQQELWLPVWIPGSYLIREFSRHLGRVTAITVDVTDTPVREITVEKISKNRWRLDVDAGVRVLVRYQVYAFDLSVRGAYLDNTRAYVNPAAVCLAVAGQEQAPLDLVIYSGAAFAKTGLACSLPIRQSAERVSEHLGVCHQLHAASYDHLIDHPLELADHARIQFDAHGIPHQIAISGHHRTDLSRLASDLQKICSYEISLFGHAPFKDYLFMVMATGNNYGGLEHQDCTSLITPRDDLPRANEPEQPGAAYRRFLGLCSHEYFHAWLVKFIRPQEFAELDLSREVWTRMLWVFEGFTSYYDDLILYRSGVIDYHSYLGLLAEQITRYLQNPGRTEQSLSDSSFDAWIKYYRPDENSANATTSYYNKGALVALCLDLMLRQRGSSLDALMVMLFGLANSGGYLQADTIPAYCERLIGDRLDSFWRDYVEGTTELPLATLLAEFGVETVLEQRVLPLGLKTSETPQGVVILQVLRDSAAADAGLSAQDVLIAIDGIRASSAQLELWSDVAGFHANAARRDLRPLSCHVFRRDELMAFDVIPAPSLQTLAKLQVTAPELLEGWLTEPQL